MPCTSLPRDVIFAWLAKYQEAKASGQQAINGTVGTKDMVQELSMGDGLV